MAEIMSPFLDNLLELRNAFLVNAKVFHASSHRKAARASLAKRTSAKSLARRVLYLLQQKKKKANASRALACTQHTYLQSSLSLPFAVALFPMNCSRLIVRAREFHFDARATKASTL